MTELTDRLADLEPDDLDEVPSNPSANRAFTDVVSSRLSRRSVLRGSMLAAAGFLTTRLAGSAPAHAAPKGPTSVGAAGKGLLGFSPVPLSTADEVVVPAGYRARPFLPWGTPVVPGTPPFAPGSPDVTGSGNTAAEQAGQAGMHHDGMHYFPLSSGPEGSRRGVLVVNHEYTDEGYLHTGQFQPPVGGQSWARRNRARYTAEMVRKSQAAHGVTVVEVQERAPGDWEVVPSRRNRRITATTPMVFSGPAAGSALLDTGEPADGRTPVGTFNNCSMGHTPWGTYLTCEENFNGYFAVQSAGLTPEQQQLLSRYGGFSDTSYNWSTHDQRFVVSAANPHAANRYGWVVEIDPADPSSTPVKRTALGRVKHEGAFVHVTRGGRVVVYMGDDQAGDYAYKFVSSANWKSLRAKGLSPLDSGTLYVARFDEDGSGRWLPLEHGTGPLTAANGFRDQGEVLVKTRLAADALGATKMDRPEWTTVDPRTGMVYLTLTNNNNATKAATRANPRSPNPWGHVIRWEEAGGDHTATTFTWDLFLLAGQGRSSGDGSTVDDDDAFGSPDGLWADRDGRIWVQTDGRQPGSANDQMLAADPLVTDAEGRPELRRFLTGVVGCEVTGVTETPDARTMFVNLQHPGEDGGSTWPRLDGLAVPRSGTVVVVKDDGGVIGT